jgi:hypothetical protein
MACFSSHFGKWKILEGKALQPTKVERLAGILVHVKDE